MTSDMAYLQHAQHATMSRLLAALIGEGWAKCILMWKAEEHGDAWEKSTAVAVLSRRNAHETPSLEGSEFPEQTWIDKGGFVAFPVRPRVLSSGCVTLHHLRPLTHVPEQTVVWEILGIWSEVSTINGSNQGWMVASIDKSLIDTEDILPTAHLCYSQSHTNQSGEFRTWREERCPSSLFRMLWNWGWFDRNSDGQILAPASMQARSESMESVCEELKSSVYQQGPSSHVVIELAYRAAVKLGLLDGPPTPGALKGGHPRWPPTYWEQRITEGHQTHPMHRSRLVSPPQLRPTTSEQGFPRSPPRFELDSAKYTAEQGCRIDIVFVGLPRAALTISGDWDTVTRDQGDDDPWLPNPLHEREVVVPVHPLQASFLKDILDGEAISPDKGCEEDSGSPEIYHVWKTYLEALCAYPESQLENRTIPWRFVIADNKKAEGGNGSSQLISRPCWPQTSLRSMVPDLPQEARPIEPSSEGSKSLQAHSSQDQNCFPYDLKLSVAVRLTSALRTISTYSVTNGPRLSKVFEWVIRHGQLREGACGGLADSCGCRVEGDRRGRVPGDALAVPTLRQFYSTLDATPFYGDTSASKGVQGPSDAMGVCSSSTTSLSSSSAPSIVKRTLGDILEAPILTLVTELGAVGLHHPSGNFDINKHLSCILRGPVSGEIIAWEFQGPSCSLEQCDGIRCQGLDTRLPSSGSAGFGVESGVAHGLVQRAMVTEFIPGTVLTEPVLTAASFLELPEVMSRKTKNRESVLSYLLPLFYPTRETLSQVSRSVSSKLTLAPISLEQRQDFLRHYTQLLLWSTLGLMEEWGIGIESHGQNMMLKVGWIWERCNERHGQDQYDRVHVSVPEDLPPTPSRGGDYTGTERDDGTTWRFVKGVLLGFAVRDLGGVRVSASTVTGRLQQARGRLSTHDGDDDGSLSKRPSCYSTGPDPASIPKELQILPGSATNIDRPLNNTGATRSGPDLNGMYVKSFHCAVQNHLYRLIRTLGLHDVNTKHGNAGGDGVGVSPGWQIVRECLFEWTRLTRPCPGMSNGFIPIVSPSPSPALKPMGPNAATVSEENILASQPPRESNHSEGDQGDGEPEWLKVWMAPTIPYKCYISMKIEGLYRNYIYRHVQNVLLTGSNDVPIC